MFIELDSNSSLLSLKSCCQCLETYNINQQDVTIDKTLFYQENLNNIESLNKSIIEEIQKLENVIKSLKQSIEEKKNNPFRKIEIDEMENIKGNITCFI